MLQTVERLVPHFSDRQCQDLAGCHAGMLVSCEGDWITSLCGEQSTLTANPSDFSDFNPLNAELFHSHKVEHRKYLGSVF